VDTFAAVLITGFNRPQFLEEQIRLLSGLGCKIYVSLDVPKKGDFINDELSGRCISVVERYTSDIEKVRISSKNLGSYIGITEGITWGFSHEEILIILEDDVRVSKAFLSFATNMLEILHTNKSVGSIAGTNLVPQSHISQSTEQLRYSAFTSSWGWATWRDRWDDYLVDIDTFPILDFSFPEKFWTYRTRWYWAEVFKDTANGKYDAWDYRWLYSNWKNQRLTLVPNSNLVVNIGFGEGATHTKDLNLPWWLPRKIDESFNATSPPNLILRDALADRWVEDNHYRTKLIQQGRASFSNRYPKLSQLYRKAVGRVG
jgi:hypothetical protein